MIIVYQYKHGLAAHKDIEEALLCSRMFLSVMNIKLALKLCHFDILSNIGWLQQLNWRHGPAIFFYTTNYMHYDIHYYLLIVFINLLNTNYC